MTYNLDLRYRAVSDTHIVATRGDFVVAHIYGNQKDGWQVRATGEHLRPARYSVEGAIDAVTALVGTEQEKLIKLSDPACGTIH